MTSATSSAAPVQRNPAARPASARTQTEQPRTLLLGREEAAVLKLDLSDLTLPKVGDLNVDGFKPTFFERLFGKR